MNISSEVIGALLCSVDIEGYIEFGAPGDEYDSEAQIIAQALARLDEVEVTQDAIALIVSEVWKESFNLAPVDLEARQSAFEDFAWQLVQNHGNSA